MFGYPDTAIATVKDFVLLYCVNRDVYGQADVTSRCIKLVNDIGGAAGCANASKGQRKLAPDPFCLLQRTKVGNLPQHRRLENLGLTWIL